MSETSEYDEEDLDVLEIIPIPTRRDIPVPVVKKFDSATPLHQIISEDLEHVHFILERLNERWQSVESMTVDNTCKLALTTMKVLETKRKLSNLQLGAPGDSKGSNWDDPAYEQ